MYPVLFSLGPFHIFSFSLGPLHFYSYGFCLALGLILCLYLFGRDAGKYIAPKIKTSYEKANQKASEFVLWLTLSSIIGARIFFIFENHEEFRGDKWVDFYKIWQGGIVYYGGFFGALVAAYFWFKAEKWPLAYSFDLVAPYTLLGQAIGRVGCFLNGCCYGNVSQKYGFVFQGGDDKLPHLPTQLWELAGDLALFFILLWGRKYTLRYSWLNLALYGLTYGTLRFVIEFWRRDWDKRYLVVFNSASQAVSAILVAASLAALVWIWAKYRKNPPPKAA